MPDLLYYDDLLYEDLGDAIEIKLHMIGGWIYIDTPIERKTVNDTELRYDGTPRNILNYVINEHPNEDITILDLIEAKLSTSRDLRQVAIKAGIKGYAKDLFMPVCDKQNIKIINKRTLNSAEAEALINSLY